MPTRAIGPGKIKLPAGLLERLPKPVYLVGGSLRDLLLGRQASDYDFTTPLGPDRVEAELQAAGFKTVTIGKRFGTIATSYEGMPVEITTFRRERYGGGSRKPDVEFVEDLSSDLSRRDFTINAMALREGKVIDPLNGQSDLREGVIRAVGVPSHRFHEDPLRMLRAARFAAQLRFIVERETLRAMPKRAPLTLDVSRERWTQELDKLLLTEQPSLGLEVLARGRLLPFILPELAIQVGYDQHSPWHELELWEHTKKTVDLTPRELYLRWAALLHDIGKPFTRQERTDPVRSTYYNHEQVSRELTARLGVYLRWSKVRIEAVCALVGGHMLPDSPLKAADGAATKR